MLNITDAVLFMEYINILLIVAAFLAEYICCTLHHLGVDTVLFVLRVHLIAFPTWEHSV